MRIIENYILFFLICGFLFFRCSLKCANGKYHSKDSYTAMKPSDPIWKCVYEIIGYDGITSTVIGYGQTEEEALIRCKELFAYLQSNYKKENEAV